MNPEAKESSKSGSALVMVLVVLLIVTALSTVSLRNSMQLMRLSQRQVWMEQAHFAAESGLEEAARLINSSTYMGASVTTVTHTLPGGGSASVVITPLNSQGNEFSIQSTSTVQGITREVNIGRIYRPTYLNYGNFYEDFQNLWWIYGELIDGKVWTGNTQNIYGYTLSNGEKYGPIFTDLNETGANGFGGYPQYASTLKEGGDEDDYDDLQFWNEYEDGYDTNVSMPALLDVDFDRTSMIADALDVDPDEINPSLVTPENMPKGKALKLKGRTEIRFSVDTIGGEEVGILEIRNWNKFGNFNWNPVYSESLDLVYVEKLTSGPGGHRGATLRIGDSNHNTPNIVKANLTVWAEDDVTIPTHIIYDNQNLDESTDKIGVISKDDIWFDRKFTGDLVVQGGYIATGAVSSSNQGELGLIDYNKFGVRGTLYFLGSMVAQRVSPFGVFSGNSFVSGFQTDHRFDKRFATDPPPFTPVISSQINYEDWF
ncbi:MAG: PilX N-terminal domain-containing pilus assembly protein [Kiritimatiellia bacterium]